ncbi:hypothetical protein CALCODRAFT_521100 [Calocera cornea HHB12733]|uniref:Uncharacterized protein n=1 Tax=Calocera cornea HHB12733 TaxID=1353952 RepID=A0A165D1P0_9BASI|nr:hypothetical protein CALCODRAFT_521100 [Calocera cornea HHB12733]
MIIYNGCLEVFIDVGHMLKKPAAVFLAFVMLAAMLFAVEKSVIVALAPLCHLPLVPSMMLEFCPRMTTGVSNKPTPTINPDFDKLMEVQLQLQGAIEESASAAPAVRSLQRSEMAVRDLTGLVKMSNISYSDEIVNRLTSFAVSSKERARGLQRFMSGVLGAVDSILAMDENTLWTLERLENAPNKEATLIEAMVYVLVPSLQPPAQIDTASRKEVEAAWLQMAAFAEEYLAKLILSGEGNLELLDQLDDELTVINELLGTSMKLEEAAISQGREQVLASLWTKLGGNQNQLRGFKYNENLLRDMGTYRLQARDATRNTLNYIRQVSADLEDLRDHVVAPLLAGKASSVPLAVHIQSIQRGARRLSDVYNSAKARAQASSRELAEGVPRAQTIGAPS